MDTGGRRSAFARPRARLVLLAGAAAAGIGVLLGGPAQAAPFAATTSVAPQVQYLNDKAGTVFTFTVNNTGTSAGIGAVQITRPGNDWTVTACPQAPAGWSASRSSTMCRYTSATTTADDLAPGTSSSAFQVKATVAGGTVDITGTWSVVVSQSNKFDNPSLLASASAPPGALDLTAHAFEILDAVVVTAPATPGANCPSGAHQAGAGTTQRVVVCGRNRTNQTLTPVAAQASLGGTFVAGSGTFTSGPVAKTGGGTVVLGTWTGVQIGPSGLNRTVVARVGSAANQTSPLTTLGGYTSINPPPVADAKTATTNEDTPVGITLTGSDPEGQAITFNAPSDPPHGTVTGTPPNVTYAPDADYFGSDSFTYTVNDGANDSAPATVSITVTPVNDRPSFTDAGNQTVLEDAGAQSVLAFATGISAGPANESTQTVAFSVTGNTNPSLFSSGPAVAANGTLSYTAAADANGSSTISLVAQDSGGTANGGVDTSTTHTFTISVTAVNDAPSFTKGGDQTVLEDSGAATVAGWATGASAGPADEAGQTLSYQVSATNTALFSVQPAVSAAGTLTFTPAADANGTTTVSVAIHDNGGTANGGSDTSAAQTFSITVTAVNDAPSFTKGANQTTLEDAGPTSVPGWATAISPGPSDESAQTVSFDVTGNTNPSLFSAGPAVAANGTLSYTPAANANGTATITLVARDSGGTANGGADTSAPQSFTISVTAVNDPPSFTSGGDVNVLEDSGAYSAGWASAISAGPADESAQTVSFGATNTNNALFSAQPAVSNSGVLTFTPAADAYGSATVTVTATDTGGTANGGDNDSQQTFTVTVGAVNDAPSFALPASPNQTVVQDSGAHTVSGFATGMSAGPNESSQTLTFQVTNTNNALFTGGGQPDVSATSGDLTFTPAAGATGTATVSVVLHDNGGTANGGVDTSAAQTFTITVTPPNATPTDIALSPGTIAENTATPAGVGTLTTTDADAGDSHTYSLVAGTGATDNASFSIAGDQLSLTGASPNYEAKSSYSVRVQTDDGHGGTFAKALVVTVLDVNEAPTDIALSSTSIAENNLPGATVGTLSATDPDTGATHTFTFAAGGADNGSFTITGTVLSINGSANYEVKSSYAIRVRATDTGGLFTEKDFTVTVVNVNEAPTDIALSSTSIAENNLPGATVGTLSATDQDAGDTQAFSLTSGGTDNGAFTITGTTLSINGAANYEAKSSYSILVRVTDSGSLTYDEAFTVTVTDVNEAPTDITLSNDSIAENNALHALVGTLSATDEDAGQIHTFSLVAGTGDTDNASFEISGSNLQAKVALNFEAKSSYSVRILATDNGTPQLSYPKAFTVSVTDVNDAPVAGTDTYSGAVGNTLAVVGTTGTGPKVTLTGNVLTANDTDEDTGAFAHALSAVAETVASTRGGSATIFTDGSFTFLPKIGDKNLTDTFTYHVTDGSLTTAGSVTVGISNNRVWYVDNGQSPASPDGRSTAPFTSLSPVNGISDADAAGDVLFVYQGASAYTGGLSLETSEKLWGQPFGLTVNNGFGNQAIVAAGGSNPTINGGLVLESGVDVQGVTLGTSASASTYALSGSSVGSSTVGQATGAQVVVNNPTGGGVDLSGGSPTVVLGSVTSTGATNSGIRLASLAGSFTVNGGALSVATGPELSINGGTGAVAIAAPITNISGGRAVDISNRTGGTVTLSGAVNDSASSGGIALATNTGSTIAFTGGVTVATSSTGAFSATGGGTVTVTGSANTLSSTSATALQVSNTTIGAAGLTFRSINAGNNSAASDPATGISLTSTGSSGRLVVSGTGTAGSGGTIQQVTGAGITLSNTLNPSFDRMVVSGTGHSGVDGTLVNGFTFTNGTITSSGLSLGVDDSNIGLNHTGSGTEQNATGTITITGNTLSNAYYNGIDIYDYAGTIDNAVITGNTITSTTSTSTSKGGGIRVIAFGNASTAGSITKATIANNTISNFPSGVGLQVQCGNANSTVAPLSTCGTPGSGTNVVTISNNTIAGNSSSLRTGAEGMIALVNGRGQGNFDITGNSVSNTTGQAISHSAFGLATVTSTISSNTIVANNTVASPGIGVGTSTTFGSTDTPSLTTTISNNNVSQTDGNGILAVAHDATGTLRVKVQNNTVAAPLSGVRPGINIGAGNASGDNDVCANISGNTSAGSGGSQGIGLRKQGTSTTVNAFAVNGMGATATPAVEAYVDGLNPAGNGTLLISATSGFSNCSLP